MPDVFFEETPFYDWTVPAITPAEVRAPAPAPKRVRKRKPPPRPSTAGKTFATSPPRGRKLTSQARTLLIDRMEAAVEDGRVDLHDDFEDCEFLDLTCGELELLVRILYPFDVAEQTARLAEIRDVIEKANKRKAKVTRSEPVR
jgi:hypothetical protein